MTARRMLPGGSPAALAAAAVHDGTEPDLPGEVASWQADDFWQYAVAGPADDLT